MFLWKVDKILAMSGEMKMSLIKSFQRVQVSRVKFKTDSRLEANKKSLTKDMGLFLFKISVPHLGEHDWESVIARVRNLAAVLLGALF